MGRGVQPRLEPSGTEDGGKEMCGGAFAVGAGNMDGGKRQLWLTKVLTECQSIAKVFFERRWPNALEHWKLRKKVFECFRVGFDGA